MNLYHFNDTQRIYMYMPHCVHICMFMLDDCCTQMHTNQYEICAHLPFSLFFFMCLCVCGVCFTRVILYIINSVATSKTTDRPLSFACSLRIPIEWDALTHTHTHFLKSRVECLFIYSQVYEITERVYICG